MWFWARKISGGKIAINISNGYKIKDGKRELLKDWNSTDKSFYDLFQKRLKFDFSQTQDKYFCFKAKFKNNSFTFEKNARQR